VLAYVSAGNYVGEMALAAKTTRAATVRAAAPTEMVVLDAVHFNVLLDENPAVRSEVSARFLERLRANETAILRDSSELVNFLMDQGVGEATDILLIDNTKCIRCNNCEKACADTHDGTSRLNIDAGHTYQRLHVPASCRHCEHPRCMKDCPPDAIHRSPNGEVFISDSCIGCGQCQSNCPYGVIQMETATKHQRASLLQLITGWGLGRTVRKQDLEPGKSRAVKCDMCRDIIGGPACVRACPTNAAFRISPERFFSMTGS
jgi:Fe-S-cluster-containing hydrogenase component 2